MPRGPSVALQQRRRSKGARKAALERPQAPRPVRNRSCAPGRRRRASAGRSDARRAAARRAPRPWRRPAPAGRETPCAGGTTIPCAITLSNRRPGACCSNPSAHRISTCGEAEGADPRGGLHGQGLEPLKRHDLLRELREQSRAIACSRSDFADRVRRLHIQRSDHRRDYRRRLRGLAAADRQRDVAAGDVGKSLRHEQRPRHPLERAQKVDDSRSPWPAWPG